ncbi:prophage MuSo2, DNA circulation protein, putative [Marinomonas sp. MED121]|uniref:DNA circularization protein n=1 Tax=Marinomonas sp. MED121 TaxID=314277 RepID=UPI0000690B20|nr:DNA circularization N-terminal domain-containing protein [Marinomonas sp. MED121]EAQ65987.1 prophage MuSo2, DNA circulation protein, putative [Marinomonas sp. MED121]
MPFEDRLMAKFRGVEFPLDTASGTSGRRAISHSYPKRDSGYSEDNGAVFKQEKIEGRFVGSDYVSRLQTLLNALNQSGPGELVHPWFGVMQVQVGNVNHKLILAEDGLATFSFDVFNAGESLFPNASIDTSESVKRAAAEARSAAQAAYVRSILSYEKALTEEAGLGDLFDQAFDDLDEFTRSIPSLPSSLKDWTNRLERAKSSIGNLLAVPGELARDAMGLIEDVKSVVTDPIQALSVYDNVRNRWDGLRAELTVRGGLGRSINISDDSTASSVQRASDTETLNAQDNNINAFNTLLQDSALVEKADAMANSNLNTESEQNTIDSLTGVGRDAVITSSQLTAIGNAIASNLAMAAEDAVERGDSDVWRTFRALRLAVLEDTRIRAQQFPSLVTARPSVTMPVALLAWQQTGNADNRASIVRRNGVANPSFIAVNESIEVING